MFHRRLWSVSDVTEEELINDLVNKNWCLCQGFRLGEYLFLNDSLNEDGAEEYAVVHEPTSVQVESLTVSWMDEEKLRLFVRRLLAGEINSQCGKVAFRSEPSGCHECVFCR